MDAALCAELLDRFEELDLVDDAAFAAQWVASRHRVRGLSRRALSNELRRKGIDADLVAQATAVVGPDEEFEAALGLARKKLRTMASVGDSQTRRRRLAGALARRGYGHEVVSGVLSRVLSEDEAEGEPAADGWGEAPAAD